MSVIDWAVLVATLFIIIAYGIYKSRGHKNIDGYLLGNQSLPWYHVCLSVMATQASSITFLSAPGLAYSTGMSFVQFYFGLPLAMIVLSISFVPIFHKLKIFTAYEFLEQRFDLKTRALTSGLFLIQRGLSTGITIYAPAIILSIILNVNTNYTTLAMGIAVIIYTVYGGTKAVSYTQLLQMLIIFTGLLFAGIMVIELLPENVGFYKALHIAGAMGRTNAIDLKFDWNNQYNVWSGIIGGFFLQLAYFGTDQSQVGRYLSGSSVNQSRFGLLINGMVKIPMQFLILLIGVLVFSFYQFTQPPIFFNKYELSKIENSKYRSEINSIKKEYSEAFLQKKKLVENFASGHSEDLGKQKLLLRNIDEKMKSAKTRMTGIMSKNDPLADTNDNNYIFLSFVTKYLPKGLVGLLIAIIFLASMGSTASALNSLASTTVIDIYRRLISKEGSEMHSLMLQDGSLFFWGIVCIAMAFYAGRTGNLIEAVNILGSLFYGTILGIFVVAFYLKHVGGTATFIAAIITEFFVFLAWKLDIMAFLWLNVLGCILVALLAVLLQIIIKKGAIVKTAPSQKV